MNPKFLTGNRKLLTGGILAALAVIAVTLRIRIQSVLRAGHG